LFPPSDLKRILIIRFARLGDVILLVPALRALRRHFPGAKLDVLVDHRYAPVLKMCSAVSEVIAVNRLEMRDGSRLKALWNILCLAENLRQQDYDLVSDFHSFRETHLLTWYSQARWRLGLKRVHSPYSSFCFNLEPVVEDDSLHVSSVFLSMLGPLGIKADASDCLLDLPSSQVEQAEAFLRPHRIAGNEWFIGFNVGAGSKSRTWPAERFAQLAVQVLQQPAARIVLFSGPREDEISLALHQTLRSSRVILANNLGLPELAALISQCKILVSNDTGPMHLGPAVGVPTLGIFSVARPEHYSPLGRFSRFVRSRSIQTVGVEMVYTEFLQIQESMHQADLGCVGPGLPTGF
jgi:ADP-heptose:LPS heptosyltransferase